MNEIAGQHGLVGITKPKGVVSSCSVALRRLIRGTKKGFHAMAEELDDDKVLDGGPSGNFIGIITCARCCAAFHLTKDKA